MSKIVKTSDLTKQEGDPTEWAVLGRALERVGLKGTLLGGNTFELQGEVYPDSPQSAANSAFSLTFAGCLVIITAAWVGVPATTALIAGLCAPAGIFLLVRLFSGRKARA